MSGISVSGGVGQPIAFGNWTPDPRMPTGALAETRSRFDGGWSAYSAGTLTSGTLYLNSIILSAGITVTNIGFYSGGAAVTPTHWWYSLYNDSGTLLAQTADQTSTAWANNTDYVLALSSAQTTAYTGAYYLGFMMAAGTTAGLVSAASTSYSLLSDSSMGGASWGFIKTNDTGLTDTAPATLGTKSYVGAVSAMYAWVT